MLGWSTFALSHVSKHNRRNPDALRNWFHVCEFKEVGQALILATQSFGVALWSTNI